MWGLKAFLLGAVAVGVVGYTVLAALAVTAQAGGRALDLALGPLTFVLVARGGTETVTTFGPGLIALALAGGSANLAAARLMRHRSRRSDDRVD
jgi:hypothetical protein